MKKIVLQVLLPFILLVWTATSCKSTGSSNKNASAVKNVVLENSMYLIEAGDNAKDYFYKLIDKRNAFAKANKFQVKFVIMDARDPRLYPPGAAIQPPSPAERAIVKIADDGRFQVLALIQDQPGFLKIKEFPSGNKISEVVYAAEKISYSSRFDGLFASATRATAGQGWMFIYYLRGWGNNVNPQQFDGAAKVFLENTMLYVTPLFPNEAPQMFGPQGP
jgi:hypothetical protein